MASRAAATPKQLYCARCDAAVQANKTLTVNGLSVCTDADCIAWIMKLPLGPLQALEESSRPA